MDHRIGDLGPNSEIETNARGGKQSKLDYAFHLLDPVANLELAKVVAEGVKRYPRDNWRLIEVEDHLNHAMTHINAFLAGDNQDNHLTHALCRLHFAVAKHYRPEYFGAMAAEGFHGGAHPL